MYGDFRGLIVYGFQDRDYHKNEEYIDDEWLEEWGLSSYATETVRCHAARIVYGIVATFDKETATAIISEEEKEAVMKLARAMGYEKDVMFHVVVRGDVEFCGEPYVPEGITNDVDKDNLHEGEKNPVPFDSE